MLKVVSRSGQATAGQAQAYGACYGLAALTKPFPAATSSAGILGGVVDRMGRHPRRPRRAGGRHHTRLACAAPTAAQALDSGRRAARAAAGLAFMLIFVGDIRM